MLRDTTLNSTTHGGTPSRVQPDGRAFKATVHRANAPSFFGALAADDQLETLHRRLHVSHDRIRRLVDLAADVPNTVAKGRACTQL